MRYQVFPEDKLLCAWDELPSDIIDEYRNKGYRVATFSGGEKPVGEALRRIILSER